MSLPSTADAVVVGAGLAALRAPRGLVSAGLDVVEAAERVGGRVATDADGFLVDRGFQIHDTGCPEAARVLDLKALDLRASTPRALVRLGHGLFIADDHRDAPSIQRALVSGKRAGAAVLRSISREVAA